MKQIFVLILGCMLSALMVACGGGGGGSASSGGCNGPSPGNCTQLYTTAGGTVQILPGQSQTFTVGGGTPPYSASSTGNAVIVSLSGTNLTITGSPGGGTASAVVTDFAGKSVSISVTVGTGLKLATTAPTPLGIPVGSTSSQFVITGGSGVYYVVSGNNAVATVGLSSGGNAFVVTGVANGSTTISVTDNAGGSIPITVNVGTGASGSTIVYTTAPTNGVSFVVGGASNAFTIGGGQAPYLVGVGNISVATATIVNTSLTITPVSVGNTTVTVTDSKGQSTSIPVIVSAGTGGGAVALYTTAPLSGVTIPIGNQATYSVGGGTPSYIVTSSNTGVVIVSPLSSGNTFTVTGVGAGTANINIVDASGTPIKLPVTVSSSAISLYTTAPTNGVSFAIGASGNYTIGGGAPPYSVASSNTGVATGSISNGTNLTINALSAGAATIAVTDSVGTPVNIQATVTGAATGSVALYTTAPSTGVAMTSGSVATYTVGGGTAPYTIVSSNVGVATVSAVSATNTFTVTAVSAGSASIAVSDATGKQVPIAVTVTTANAVKLYTTAPTTGVSFAVSATGTFTVGGGTAPYSVTSSASGVATANISGTTLTVNAIAAGSATLAVSDATGYQITLGVTVSNGPSVPLFTNAPITGVTLAVPNTSTYTIGGGTAPYTVNTSNASAATVTVNAANFTVTAVAAGSANIVVTDSAGSAVPIPFTISAGSVSNLALLPSSVVANAGNTLNFNVYGGTPPYTLTANNPSIAKLTTSSSVAASGGGFSVLLTGTGTASVSVLDSKGVSQTLSIVANVATNALNLTPSSFLLGETSTQVIPLTVSNGSGSYSVYTSNLQLSSLSISGSTVNVGLGTQGTRCLSTSLPNYSPATGQYPVTITVVDNTSGTSATSTMTIQKGLSCP